MDRRWISLRWRKILYYFNNLFFKKVHIMSIDDTLQEILLQQKSVCRFGDGELDIIMGGSIGFQRSDSKLAEDLSQVLRQTPSNCIICVPDAINRLSNLTDASLLFWLKNMAQHRQDWLAFLSANGYRYGTTNITRCYIRYRNKHKCAQWFAKLRSIWSGKEIIIVEGSETRLGVGNDLLENAKKVSRIIAPSENAYDKIDAIEETILTYAKKENPILLALGPTATVLAFRLSQKGYWALDVGHCDIEYEWYRRGAEEKIKIEGKYTNEVENGNVVSHISDSIYLQSIIASIE